MGKVFLALILAACIVAGESGIIQKIKDRLRKGDEISNEVPEIQAGIIQKIKDKLRRGDEVDLDTVEVYNSIIQKIKDRLRKGNEVDDDEEEYASIIQKIKDRLRKVEEVGEDEEEYAGIIQKIKDRLRKVEEIEDEEEYAGIIQKIKDRLRKVEEVGEDEEEYAGIIQKIKDRLRKVEEIEDEEEYAGIIQKIKDRLRKGESIHSRPDGWADCIQEDVDAYLDKVLVKVRQQIEEPMRLPPRSSFVELSEGRVWGMNEVKRQGPVKVECHDNQTVIISGRLVTDELKGRYTWHKEIAGKEREGFIMIKTKDFAADFELIIDQKSADTNYPKLEVFRIRRFKDLKVEMTGLGFLTWAFAEISTMMSGIFQWGIAKAVQGPLREALERELMEISLN